MRRSRLHHLPAPVARVLGAFDRLTRLYRLLAILGGGAILYLLLALAAMHADRFFFLSPETRSRLGWIVQGVTAAVLAVRLAAFGLRRSSVRRVAYDLQNRLPGQAAERYVTLDSVLREPPAPENAVRQELLDQLKTATEAHSAQVKPFRLVRDRALGAVGIGLAAVGLVYGLLALAPGYQFPLMVRRFVHPGANLPKPSFVKIRVSPAEVVIGRGGEVVLQAETQGDIPAGLAWLYKLAGAVPGRCLMASRPGRPADVPVRGSSVQEWSRVQRQLFLYARADLQESFSYRLRCGDAETEVRFVEVVAQPRITEMRIRVQPPAYTRLPASEIVNPKQPLRLYAGSAVELVFAADQAVTNREVVAGKKAVAKVEWDETSRTGRYAFTMTDKVDLEVRVVNARGFANADRARVSLVKLEDQSPTVQLEYPPSELAVVPGELVPLQALAEDDLEVVSAAVRFQLNPELNPDAPFQELPIELGAPAGPRLALTENVDLGRTSAGPGDEILMVVRVRDSKGNDGESRPVRIRVNAFARGENERRRLAALEVVQAGLAALGESPAAGVAAIDRERFGVVAKKAAGAGVFLEEPATVGSLLRLIEREQHFTDAPDHKEDVRRLAAVLDAAWKNGRLPGADAGSAAWPAALATNILAPMAASRRLQNVTWRLYGMQSEMADIRQRLQGLGADEADRLAGRQQLVASFLEAVAEEAARGKAPQEAARQELALRKAISAAKAHAVAVPKEEGEVVANPFAPVQLDVDEARLSPEDTKKVADLNRQLKEVVAERKRLGDAAVAGVTNLWLTAHKGQPLPLAAPELASLAASIYDRVLVPPTGAAPVDRPEARRQLAASLAADRVKDRSDGEGPQRKALHRRAELFLKALEEIGVDLAGVADAAPGKLNADRLKALQGDVNTAGYYLSRGNAARETASCDDVSRLLGQLLDEVRPGLPALLRDEQKARKVLEGLYATAWREVATGPADRERLEWSWRWVESNIQMLERNPFAPVWPRALDLALLEALESRSAGPQTNGAAANLAALMEPDAAVVRAVADERRFWCLMAAEWEIGELAGMARVSSAEKALAAGLIEYGAALENGEAAAALIPGEPGAGLRRQREAMDLKTIEAVLAPLVKGRVLAGTPLEAARSAQARLDGAARAVAALDTALTEGGPGVTNAILQATDTLAGAVRACERVVRLAMLDTDFLDPLGPEAASKELLAVRIREAAARYQGRAAESVRVMRETAGRELDAAQLGNLGADLTIVKAGVQALQNNLAAAVAEYGTGGNRKTYPILETFAETRVWMRDAGELPGHPAETAARLIGESPFARAEYLAIRSAVLEAALKELDEAARLSEQPAVDAAAVQRKIQSAQAGLAAFLSAIAKAGKSDLADTLRKGAGDLAGRLERLGNANDARRFLALADVVKDGHRLLRGLRAEAGAAAETMEYAGGPDRIWAPETRQHAEEARQRLLAQIGWGRRAFTRGMLEALEPAPDAGRYADAAAWSLFVHRVARSPLSGAVTPPRSEAGGESARNPLVKWLLEQMDEAAKETQGAETLRNYRGITRELIPTLKDFLRY